MLRSAQHLLTTASKTASSRSGLLATPLLLAHAMLRSVDNEYQEASLPHHGHNLVLNVHHCTGLEGHEVTVQACLVGSVLPLA